MAGQTDILTAIQQAVVALNGLNKQANGSLLNIQGQLTTLQGQVTTLQSQVTALQADPYKIVIVTRVLSLASGLVSTTGVGFQPRLILFLTGISGGSNWGSVGMTDGTFNECLETNSGSGAGAVYFQPGIAGIGRDNASGTNYQTFVLSSFDSNGFTLSWTKSGSPTATATIAALCFR